MNLEEILKLADELGIQVNKVDNPEEVGMFIETENGVIEVTPENVEELLFERP